MAIERLFYWRTAPLTSRGWLTRPADIQRSEKGQQLSSVGHGELVIQAYNTSGRHRIADEHVITPTREGKSRLVTLKSDVQGKVHYYIT